MLKVEHKQQGRGGASMQVFIFVTLNSLSRELAADLLSTVEFEVFCSVLIG